jgi:L-asparaginase
MVRLSSATVCAMDYPKLIIHGGAGRAMRDPSRAEPVRAALTEVVSAVYPMLLSGKAASDAVREACRMLENDPNFNAGTGAVMQVDGQIRLSASIMDGPTQKFSGIVNGRRIRNPTELAWFLQSQDDRVLASEGVDELARQLSIPIWDNLTERRLSEWIDERKADFEREMASVTAEESEDARSGTIGAVALDLDGNIVAGTSTGGRGFERIGRVSDSAMPAGNFANAHAGVSATGVGEHIMDEALASTIVIRRTDGMSLEDAMRLTMEQSHTRDRLFGAIAVDRGGAIVYGKTSEILLAAYCAGQDVVDTVDLPTEPLTRRVG